MADAGSPPAQTQQTPQPQPQAQMQQQPPTQYQVAAVKIPGSDIDARSIRTYATPPHLYAPNTSASIPPVLPPNADKRPLGGTTKEKAEREKAASKGFFAKLSAEANRVARELDRDLNKLTATVNREYNKSMGESSAAVTRFRTHFTNMPPELIYGEWHAYCVSGDSHLDGLLYITEFHVCFTALVGQERMLLCLPLAHVASVQRGVAAQNAETPGGKISVTLAPLHEEADVLLLFMYNGQVIELFHLHSHFSAVYETLDFKWRSANPQMFRTVVTDGAYQPAPSVQSHQ